MAKISPLTDGPLLAKEIPSLTGADGQAIETDKTAYGLCRCGQSANKPFCDGAHTAAGFKSGNGDANIRNTPLTYSGDIDGRQVTIAYTPVLCGHIAECQRLHKTVFDPSRKPWIQPENGTLDGVLSVIRACPSGALRVAVDGEELHHLDSDTVSVDVVANGPYVVRNVELDAEFNGAGASKKEYILCRCGHSKNKPFCDGTHHDVQWRDNS